MDLQSKAGREGRNQSGCSWKTTSHYVAARAPAAKHVWSHRQRSLIAPSQTREPDCYQCTCISVTAWILHLFKIWSEHSLWITAILCRCKTSRGLMNEGWLLWDKLQGNLESQPEEKIISVWKSFSFERCSKREERTHRTQGWAFIQGRKELSKQSQDTKRYFKMIPTSLTVG